METRVKIPKVDSDLVERLFIEFQGYCNILGYLGKYGSFDQDIFDKKWSEAVQLNYELEQAKLNLDQKYHPNDGKQYKQFIFDFSNQEMVYKDE